MYYGGEEFIIQKQGKPAVRIIPEKKRKTRTAEKKKMSGTEFLLKLSKYNVKGLPKDLAQNHDKYT